ncbi:MAG: flagellar type III secretion system pore protein FliP [Acidobacteriota bacterium]
MMRRVSTITFCLALALLAGVQAAPAFQQPIALPKVAVDIGRSSNPSDVAVTLQILALMTVLSLAPALLIMTTAFTRIIIVFHFLKQALGTAQMPPSQIIIGLAMFLTFFIMAPTWNKVNTEALQPYLNGKMTQAQAYDKGIEPIRQFMFRQTREKDLALFMKLSNIEKPNSRADIPTLVLIPAYAISELRTGFIIGFVLFVPFLIIDIVVSSILMAMGMMMLPPMMISLPFKILLFILVDGWYLLVTSLMQSFG